MRTRKLVGFVVCIAMMLTMFIGVLPAHAEETQASSPPDETAVQQPEESAQPTGTATAAPEEETEQEPPVPETKQPAAPQNNVLKTEGIARVAQDVLFEDDFSGDLSKWEAVQGSGSIANGEFAAGAVKNMQYSPADPLMYTKGDAVYEFRGRCASASSWFGLQFNMQSKAINNWDNTGYMIYVRSSGTADLIKGTGAAAQSLAKDVAVNNFSAGQMTRVRVEYTAEGGNIKAYFNDEESPSINVNDASFEGGYFGIVAIVGSNAHFDDIKVWGEKDPAAADAEFDETARRLIVYEPLRDETEVALPRTPDGYTAAYKSSSPAGYLDAAGTTLLKRPAAGSEDKILSVTYELKRESDGKTGDVTLKVPISATYTKPNVSQETIDAEKAKYSRQKYGLFVHYVPTLTTDPKGKVVNDIDDLADRFDAAEFAKEAHDMGYEYVIFTVLHMNQCTLYPSQVNKRWRDDRRTANGAKTYSDRDVIADLADELDKYGIDLHLYVHPVDGHDFTAEDKEITGWNDCGGDPNGDHSVWNQFQNELYDEICQRYQGRIKGLWFDGFYTHTRVHGEPFIDLPRLNETLRAYDPTMFIVSNTSPDNTYDPQHQWVNTDGWSWELGQIPGDVANPTVTTDQAAALVVGDWWTGAKDQNMKYTKGQMFRYLAGQAATSVSGGFAVSTGAYPDSAAEQGNGNLFAGNFYETMTAMYNENVKNVEESIKNTNAGRAYRTRNKDLLNAKWGVSTESADGKYVYLHVLKKPAGKVLELPDTDDGSVLGGKAVRLHFDGMQTEAAFEPTQAGYSVTLADGETWDSLDTIIRVERLSEGLPNTDVTKEITPDSDSAATTGKWTKGATFYTNEHGATLEFTFEGSFIDWYGVVGMDHGNAKVSIDGNFIEEVDCTGPRQDGVKVFGWEDPSNESKEHTIKLETIASGEEKYIEVSKFVYGVRGTRYALTYEGTEGAVNKNPGFYVPGHALKLAPISREGKKFDGWYDAQTGGSLVTEIPADATGEKTLYARWSDLEEKQVAKVTAAPAAGKYAEAQEVELSCATQGATIHYTTDGNEPTVSSSEYTGAITVDQSKTIRAFAVKEGMADSAKASFTYTIEAEEDPFARFTYTAFEDDFSDQAASNAKWSQNPNIVDGEFSPPLNAKASIRDITFDAALYEMDITVNGADWVGLLFNRGDPSHTWDDSGYVAYMRNTGGVELYNKGSGMIEAGQVPDYTPGEKVPFKVLADNGTIQVYAKGTKIIDAKDDVFTGGYAGVLCSGTGGSGKVDNVKVMTPPPVPDGDAEIEAVFADIKGKLDQTKIYIDGTEFRLPETPAKYKVAIVDSSDKTLVNTAGKVAPPSSEQEVTLTFELAYEFAGKTKKDTYEKKYIVPRATTPGDIGHFLDDKYGLFVHYVWPGERNIGHITGAMNPDGTKMQTIDQMIEEFDAEQFAKDCEAMGMQYVIFTVWHYGMNPVYPSEVYKDWRTYEDGDIPTDDGQHDLIDKVYQALSEKGIGLYLYTHPYDLHDFYEEDKERFDYKYNGDLTFDYDAWNDYVNAQYGEMCERYQGKIKGMFVDEGLANPANNLAVDYPRLRDTVKSVDPSLVMFQNEYHGPYSCDTSMWELPTAWHGGQYDQLDTWQVNSIPIGTSIGNINYGYGWWAQKTRGEGTEGLETAENAYIYTVLEAGANTEGGGIAWAAGPYAGKDEDGMWEDGVKDRLVQLGNYIRPVEESIKNTRPSKSFVTSPYATFGSVTWGAATESADGKTTYIHVLKPPADSKTLNLGVPADGKGFADGRLLVGGKEVTVSQDAGGVSVTIPDDAEWDALDTVIVLSVDAKAVLLGKIGGAQSALDNAVTWLWPESAVKAFEDAIAAAREVHGNPTATKAELEQAAEDLAAAQEAFEKARANSVAGENYALGKTATASSTISGHPNYRLENLTDGLKWDPTAIGWSSDPHSEVPDKTEWVEIDLGGVMRVGRVDLTPAKAGGYAFPEDFYIEVSTDGINYTKVYECAGQPLDEGVREIHFAARDARYIRMTGTKLTPDQPPKGEGASYRMQLGEIEVYGMSAEEAAYRLGELTQPDKNAAQLALPEAPEGFTVAIASSSDESKVGLDGKLTLGEDSASVNVTFTVTRDADGASATSRTMTVELPSTLTLSGITMKSVPQKTVYTKGEALDVTGAQIELTYSNGKTEIKDVTAEMVSGYDANKAGEQTLTVTYEGKKATFQVTVNAPPVDKGGLQSLYDANKDKTQGSYTDESWAAFTKALGDVKAALDDTNATQDDVNNAKTALEQAIAGLTEKGKSIVDQINEAPAGGTVVVPVDANGRIPADALSAAKGKDVNLVTNYGSYSWTVNGKEITGTIDETGYDLTVKALSDAKLSELAGGKEILQIEIAHSGELPFKATLRLYVGTEHEGKTAHLYYYNEGKGALEYHSSAKVNGGYATFEFTHCSKYVITLEKLGTAADSGNKGGSAKTGDETNFMLWLLIAVVAVGAIGGACVSRLRKRKQA